MFTSLVCHGSPPLAQIIDNGHRDLVKAVSYWPYNGQVTFCRFILRIIFPRCDTKVPFPGTKCLLMIKSVSPLDGDLDSAVPR
jgi:hypothetical protein